MYIASSRRSGSGEGPVLPFFFLGGGGGGETS